MIVGRGSLVLTEEDMHRLGRDRWDAVCGMNLDLLLVPRSCQAWFFDTVAWKALCPAIVGGRIVFYDEQNTARPPAPPVPSPGPRPQPDTEFSLETTARAAYLTVARGTVACTRELIPGKLMANLDGDGRLIGVEVLL